MIDNTTYIIADAGFNHNGSVERAIQMIEVARNAGADAVSFQCFIPELPVARGTPGGAYRNRELSSQSKTLRDLALKRDEYRQLMVYCGQKGADYLCSPFDTPSLRFLCEEINLQRIKFGPGEITNGPLLLQAAENGRQVILSTGMSTLQEVKIALSVLAFGYTRERCENPSLTAFTRAFHSRDGQLALKQHVSLLHCASAYPSSFDNINLRAMDTLAREMGLPVGFSDQSPGLEIPVAAVARGARVIEKRFTMNRNLPGPDHKASLEPEELKRMVQAIRHVEKAMGGGGKYPCGSEAGARRTARKQLVAAKIIKAGELFNADNLTAKLAKTGMSPMQYWELLGQAAPRDFQPDEAIEP